MIFFVIDLIIDDVFECVTNIKHAVAMIMLYAGRKVINKRHPSPN